MDKFIAHILVVDDDDGIRSLVKKYLNENNFLVTTADNAENALEKIKIIKSLWRIIYSNKNADIYETNLMRRLSGLLYIDSKIMGDIKEEIKKESL